MKLIINKCYDKLKLIKFFRSFDEKLTLTEAINMVDNLPFTYELPEADCKEIQNKIKNFTNSIIKKEDAEEAFDFLCYNLNINPPQEYIDAMAWYESCSEEQKNHIDQIVRWRNRPAVC